MSMFRGLEHLLQVKPPNFPVDINNYLVIHGAAAEIFDKEQVINVDLCYD